MTFIHSTLSFKNCFKNFSASVFHDWRLFNLFSKLEIWDWSPHWEINLRKVESTRVACEFHCFTRMQWWFLMFNLIKESITSWALKVVKRNQAAVVHFSSVLILCLAITLTFPGFFAHHSWHRSNIHVQMKELKQMKLICSFWRVIPSCGN